MVRWWRATSPVALTLAVAASGLHGGCSGSTAGGEAAGAPTTSTSAGGTGASTGTGTGGATSSAAGGASGAAGAGGGGAAPVLIADFALEDVNASSPTFGTQVSPRDYLEQVSGWFFGEAT